MADEKSKIVAAPYLPFKTFLSSLEPFSQGLPPKIDRTIWRSQSGFMQGLIMNTFRFFKLIDDNDRPTELLHQIAKKKDEQLKPDLANLLRISYAAVMEHDLMTMTPKMLDEILEKSYSVGGDTKKKAGTFFLQAVKHANIPFSSFLSVKTRNTTGRKRRVGTRENGNAETPNYVLEMPPTPAEGHSKSIQLSGGGTVTLSLSANLFSLKGEDRKFVFDLIDLLDNYESEHPTESDEEEGQ